MADLFEIIDLVQPLEKWLVLGLVDPIKARVIRTPFHVRRRKFPGHYSLQKRDVLFHQLFLQVLCAGRDDNASLFAECCRDRRDKISESFPRSSSRLDDQMALVIKRTHDS